ncbi:unnamed protein product [Musa acuminata subsp. burmannicoides]
MAKEKKRDSCPRLLLPLSGDPVAVAPSGPLPPQDPGLRSLLRPIAACPIVKSPPDSTAKQANVISNGTFIWLQHMRTRKWLHSHQHTSPITDSLEVSNLFDVLY